MSMKSVVEYYKLKIPKSGDKQIAFINCKTIIKIFLTTPKNTATCEIEFS